VATTGWKLPGTAISDVAGETGTVSWANVTRVRVDDNSAASVDLNFSNQISRTIRASNFGFTASDIPPGSTILGVEVEIERVGGNSSVRDYHLQLVPDGSAGNVSDRVGDDKADTGTTWPTGPTFVSVTYGGAADTWAAGLTQAQVTSSAFGVDFQCRTLTASTSANVEHIAVRITYLPPISAALTVTESDDAIAASGVALVKAAAEISEADDTIIGGTVSVPVLDLDFTAGALPTEVAFTRGSVATFVNASGLIEQVSGDTPRFHYDPITHECRGILVEEQRTNLLLNSLLNGTSLSTQDVTVSATAYTLSFYGTGSITLSGAHSATLNGSGAYPARATLTFTPSAGPLTLTVAGSVQYAQLEAGAFATSYIPTDGATVTRNADKPVWSGTSFSTLWNSAAGSVVIETENSNLTAGANKVLFAAHDNAGLSNFIQVFLTSGLAAFPQVRAAGVDTVGFNAAGETNGGITRNAMAFAADDVAISVNGRTPGTDSSVTMPAGLVRMSIGWAEQYGGLSMNGVVRRLRYFDARISNAQLKTLTAMPSKAAIVEAGDGIAAAAQLLARAVASLADAGDTLAGVGTVPVKAIAAMAEDGDAIAAAAIARAQGIAVLAEESDGVASTAIGFLRATLALVEADDGMAATIEHGSPSDGAILCPSRPMPRSSTRQPTPATFPTGKSRCPACWRMARKSTRSSLF